MGAEPGAEQARDEADQRAADHGGENAHRDRDERRDSGRQQQPAGITPFVAIPLCVLAAMIGGALVGFIPGVLRARFGAHEVIATI
ncbi:MAG TPA: hypothetical protein VE861_11225, partial [Gemmatimonadaceae bacterium]|nr:hypothetical protein [Gemmatimonadaceae bacterium]